MLPFGISSGFVSITLPFILTHDGFSVIEASAIGAMGLFPNVWRFLWGPVADLTLTMRRWYCIGIASSVATLLLLALAPLHGSAGRWLGAVVFISQVAASLVILPVGGLLAHTVSDAVKGRAAGWFQAGNLGGTGIGGGAGLWLATHYSRATAGSVLAFAMVAFGVSILFVPDVRVVVTETVGERLRLMARDVKTMVSTRLPLFTIALVITPIGAGAMIGLWSAVSADWSASADRVALVTGLLGGLVSAIGCLIGGWIADRHGRWWAYFGSGVALAAAASLMALAPRSPLTYSVGVLAYSLFCGMAYSAFSAIILFAIGRGVASTKYALLSSLGNIPVIYMTLFNGWMHDSYGVTWMLHAEALVSMVSVIAAVAALRAVLGKPEIPRGAML